MRADIVPGAAFPDYELSDHRGKHRTLSELQQGDPLVVVLSRGGFCPKDRRQHEGLLQLHREMQVGYCRLVTISTDNLLETNEFRAGIGAHWTFLSDPSRKLQKDLDIAEYTDPHHNPMIPHTLVLEPGLRIYKIYNGYWFFGRPTVEELRHDLRRPAAMPSRLGHQQTGAASSLGERREGVLPPIWKKPCTGVGRKGLKPFRRHRAPVSSSHCVFVPLIIAECIRHVSARVWVHVCACVRTKMLRLDPTFASERRACPLTGHGAWAGVWRECWGLL